MASVHCSVPTVVHGPGAFEELGNVVAEAGRRALLVTGLGAMREQGFIDRAGALLDIAGVAHDVFEGVPPEPPLACVDACRTAARDLHADVLIGIGGGSALDVAKATAALLHEPEATSVYFHGEAAMQGARAAFVGVPSTFGAGTEATPNAVLSDPERGVKKSIRHETMFAAAAVVDPELGRSAPASVKAASGMDALTQAIEGYLSRHATELTEPMSLRATRLLAGHLERFVRDPADDEAATACAEGSLLAGMAFSNARLGVVHGLAHPLGIRYHAAHGRLCGILLPYALRLNQGTVPEKYWCLSEIAGGDVADFCEGLLGRLDLPANLTELAVAEEDLPGLIAAAMPSGSLKANPRVLTEADVDGLLRDVGHVPVRREREAEA